VSASYSGDSAHAASSSATTLTVATTVAVTSHQLIVFLTSDTASSTKARISQLLKSGGLTFSFKAPTAGTATIAWYRVQPGAHLASRTKQVLVARGRLAFPSAGARRMRLKLMPAGKRLLLHTKRIRLIAKGTFTPPGQASVTTFRTFTLAR